MLPKRYTDPLGSRLPALERNMLTLRAIQIMLVLFHVEEIKRKAVDLIQTTETLRARFSKGQVVEQRVPKGARNATEKALRALVDDGAITASDKDEIVGLIDYRNAIGHRVHNLVADLSSERLAREVGMFAPERLRPFDYEAVDNLRRLSRKLSETFRTHYYAMTYSTNALIFEGIERTMLDEIKRLKRKITRLDRVRNTQIRALNAELRVTGKEFVGELEPGHPRNRRSNGRLTVRGEEICYRLYDRGRSPMAVAHLMGMTLRAAANRKVTWMAIGGRNRPRRSIEGLPDL